MLEGDAPKRAATADRLARSLAVPHVLARVLAARGITSPEEAGSLLSPSMLGMHDPAGMPGCDIAAQRIIQAADVGEPIVIYGDYDVDGIAATAILFHTLRAVAPKAEVRTYVPHRIHEGYGLNDDALRSLAAEGAKVVVTVDCGITAEAPAEFARTLGVDLIITDHHNMPGESAVPDDHADDPDAPPTFAARHHVPGENGLPNAYAIVHPRLRLEDQERYPFGDLCGAAVAFKLAWRVAVLANGGEKRVSAEMRELLLDLLALAGLGTIADVVPLVDENLLIARFGLRRLKATRLVGLSALVGAAGLTGESVSAEDAGFKLAPHLNACGRMGTAAEAVEMMTVATAGRASEIARSLESQNTARRAEEKRIFEEAAQMAEAAGMTAPGARAIVLAHEGWHVGVVGIVCSRMVERFGVPALLAQRRDDGLCKGSGRSVDGYDLYGALAACSDHLEAFGGHTMAAGFTARESSFHAFVETLCAHAAANVTEHMTMRQVVVDAVASIAELTDTVAAERLRSLGPFGRGNPEPKLLLERVVLRSVDPLGKHGAHARLVVEQPEAVPRGSGLTNAGSRPRLTLKAWGGGHLTHTCRIGDVVDVVVAAEINVWNGVSRVEARLVDLRRV